MLTEKQLEQLTPLIFHPKYGKLLVAAIQTWKQKDIKPKNAVFGIEHYWDYQEQSWSDHFVFDDQSDKHCCLLAGAVVTKKIPEDLKLEGYHQDLIFEICNKEFDISENEFYSIVNGFDNEDMSNSGFTKIDDAYNFAAEVRKIVLGV